MLTLTKMLCANIAHAHNNKVVFNNFTANYKTNTAYVNATFDTQFDINSINKALAQYNNASFAIQLRIYVYVELECNNSVVIKVRKLN